MNECLDELPGLLDRLEGQTPDAGRRVLAEALDFHELCEALPTGAPPADRRIECERLLERAGDVLATFGIRLRVLLEAVRLTATLVPDPTGGNAGLDTAGRLFTASLRTLEGCVALCRAARASPKATAQFCVAGRLVLLAGPRLIEELAAAFGASAEPVAAMFFNTIHGMMQCVGLLRQLRMEGTVPAEATTLFEPPGLLLRWAAESAGQVQACLPTIPDGVSFQLRQHLLALVLEARSVAEAAGAPGSVDAALVGPHAQQLLGCSVDWLREVVQRLQTAAGAGSGASAGTLHSLISLANNCLNLAGLARCWPAYLSSLSGDAYRALLALASELPAALPLEAPPEAPPHELTNTHLVGVRLPLLAAGLLAPGPDGRPEGTAEHQSWVVARVDEAAQRAGQRPEQLIAWLLGCLPAAARVMRWAADDPDARLLPPPDGQQRLAAVVQNWGGAISDVCGLGTHRTLRDPALVARWAEAAGAALRLLPCLAGLHVRWTAPRAPPGSVPLVPASRTAAASTASFCILLWADAATAAAAFAQGNLDPAAAAQLHPALAALHTAACRLAHWVAARASQAQLQTTPELASRPTLAAHLDRVYGALAAAQAAAEPPVPLRQRQAAAAAHWRALAALLGPMLLDGTGLSGVAWEPAVAQALAQHAAACAAAVPGLCRDVRLPALLSTLLRDLAREEARGSQTARTAHLAASLAVLRSAGEAPRLGAVLASSGMLNKVLSEDWSQPTGAHQDLDAAARAALEALHAAAAAVGSCAGSAASLRQRLDGPAASPRDALPDAEATAAALLEHWREAGPQRADEEELSRLAAARSCAYLDCHNLDGGGGGAAAGLGEACKRCSACKAAWFCGTQCHAAGWKAETASHKRACRLLGEERLASKAGARA